LEKPERCHPLFGAAVNSIIKLKFILLVCFVFMICKSIHKTKNFHLHLLLQKPPKGQVQGGTFTQIRGFIKKIISL